MKSKIKLTFSLTSTGEEVVEFTKDELKERIRTICKPCWELKYCPYGSLVEGFPLPPIPRHRAIKHNEYLKECLNKGILGDGQALEDNKRKYFEIAVNDFNEKDYPKEVIGEVIEMSCSKFGHLCPVFFSAELFTETEERRNPDKRKASRPTEIKVVRRDDSICQNCSSSLRTEDIEIDHVIPHSKGGPTAEGNLRVLCSKCNRAKSDTPDHLLDNDSKLSARKKFYNKDREQN